MDKIKDYNEFISIIRRDFDLLYKGYDYFSIHDGWFDLIIDMSSEICQKVAAKDLKEISIIDVKEKYGQLSFYYITDNMSIYNYKIFSNIIEKYEDKSSSFCYKCGSTNDVIMTNTGWIKPVCRSCRIIDKLKDS
jgi:hypothetical protein